MFLSRSLVKIQYCAESPWPQTARARIINPVSGGAVSSQHLQEVLLVQFGLFVHKGDLKPHSFHFSSEHKLMKDDMYVIILVIFTAYLICM